MSSPTPTGPIAVAIDGLRTLISNLPFFQTWTGTANAAAALARIFIGDVGIPITGEIRIASGVCTLTARNPHGMLVADVISVEGASVGAQSELNIFGTHTLTAVTANTVSFTTALADATGDFPDFAFILPCARPIAVIGEASEALKSSSIGTGGASVLSGAIDVLIEANTGDEFVNSSVNANTEARNSAGTFLQQLIQTQGSGDYILLNGVEMVSLEFTSEGEQDNSTVRFERWRALFRCTWGLDG